MQNEKQSLTRRGFLKGTVAGAGALAAGAALATKAQAAPVPKKWDMEADVVVAGFGGAGACAALEAAQAGSTVLLFEKAGVPGGSTRLSGGIVYAARTRTQQEAGLQDTPEAMYNYLMACGQGRAVPELVKTVADMSNENIEWLKNLGAQFPPELLAMSGMEGLPEYAAVTQPMKRGHRVKGGGRVLFTVMQDAVKARKNIKVVLGASVTRPITRATSTDSGCEILGVKVMYRGKEINVRAGKAVILATGGIVSGQDAIPWLKDYSPQIAMTVPTGDIHATGDGYKIGIYCGGALKGLNTACCLPSALFPGQKMASIVYANIWGIPNIYVNQEGKRFTDEGAYYVVVCEEMISKKATTSYCIFDAVSVKKALDIAEQGKARGISPQMTIAIGLDPKNIDEQVKAGDLWKADSIAELAGKLQINPTALEKTLEVYNANAASGKDPDFSRKKAVSPVKTPPYYAFKVNVGMVAHDGGLSINTRAQVLDAYGSTIPRLYAAGRDAVGLFGNRYPGSGSAIADLLAFGRIAGKTASLEKPWK